MSKRVGKYRILKNENGWFQAQRKQSFWWVNIGSCCIRYSDAAKLCDEDQARRAGPKVVYENWK